MIKNKKMKNVKIIALLTFSLIAGNVASAQQDAENLVKARNAVDVSHKCDEATRYLNLVSPAYRQTPEYILCMGKTQDCMQNNEQALYYYNKYLTLNPANDTVKRRVAELTDQKNHAGRTSNNGEQKAKEIYQTTSKNRKRRRKNLDDNYYSSGIGLGTALGGDKSPYKNSLDLQVSNGFMMIHDQAVLDINSSTSILLSPNEPWFAKAAQAPAGSISNFDAGGGFSEVITVGFSPVLINKKDVALTAGVMGGVDFYLLENAGFDYYNTVISNKVTLCYGIKSNLYLGSHVMFFLDFLLNAANTADVSNGLSSYTVPTSFNMMNIGVAVKIDSWW
jgi:hypothetical protein